MEQYLVLLFLLFSVVSALLERRKRARQLEEAKVAREKRLEREKQQGGTPLSREEPEEAEEEEVWPFPMGDDLVEPRRDEDGRGAEEREAEALPPPPTRGRSLMELLEDQMREAEEGARRREEHLRKEQVRAREAADQARQQARQVQPRQPLGELVKERMDESRPRRRRRGPQWSLNPRSAREAIVLAEILGRPVGEREDAFWQR